jgi:hypothetical protein
MIVVGLPLTAWAQQHRHDIPLEPHLDQAPEGAAMGGMMPCPMMGRGMGAGPMPGMSSPMPEQREMGPGMARERQGMTGPHGAMMSMMPGAEADPKARARWMQMRGEMMKAMGEILLRYGREIEAGK